MQNCKKYFSFSRLRFSLGLQYRAAAFSGAVTQLLWWLMECLVFWAFREANTSAYPMAFSAPLFLGIGVTMAFCMFTYILSFFIISPQGLRMLFTCMVDFLSGAIIPLPFMPDGIREVVELLPFASMFNVPLRIYSGDLAGMEMVRGIGPLCF